MRFVHQRKGCFAIILAMAALGSLSCGETEGDEQQSSLSPEQEALLAEELPVGDVNEPYIYDSKSDSYIHNGEPDFSRDCKPIPELEPLNDPAMIVSLDGLTLRLFDQQGDYEKVFPIGAGRLNSRGRSLTPTSHRAPDGVFYIRADEPAYSEGNGQRWVWNYSCRIWGKHMQRYFAGLPFLRFDNHTSPSYGIHGPINDYWEEDGGNLKRGYVSAGCVRMLGDDVLEIFARIQGHRVPVKIQDEVDRFEDGLLVDSERHVGSECVEDSDCEFDGATCQQNPVSGRGFCTKSCQSSAGCAVEAPESRRDTAKNYCVNNFLTDDPTDAHCVTGADWDENFNCGRFGQFAPATLVSIDEYPTEATVCTADLSNKWIGRLCELDAECASGQCLSTGDGVGVCTEACDGFCPDRSGEPMTRCVAALDGREEGGSCVLTCTDDAECPDDFECVDSDIYNRDLQDKVCIPR